MVFGSPTVRDLIPLQRRAREYEYNRTVGQTTARLVGHAEMSMISRNASPSGATRQTFAGAKGAKAVHGGRLPVISGGRAVPAGNLFVRTRGTRPAHAFDSRALCAHYYNGVRTRNGSGCKHTACTACPRFPPCLAPFALFAINYWPSGARARYARNTILLFVSVLSAVSQCARVHGRG